MNQSEVREERFDEEAWNGKMKRREEWVKRHEKIFGESQWETKREGPWRERKRWRGAGCAGEAHPLFLPEGTHPLILPGVAHPLFLTEWREEQQGGEGGKGGGGGHPLFVPG